MTADPSNGGWGPPKLPRALRERLAEVAPEWWGWPRWIDPGDPNLREVSPGLFVGSYDAPRAGTWDLAVDLCGHSLSSPSSYRTSQRVVAAPIEDGIPIPFEVLDAVVPEIVKCQEDGGRVLVHCAAGLSRSVSVAYAVLRRRLGLAHDEALRRARDVKGPSGYPMPATLASARRWSER